RACCRSWGRRRGSLGLAIAYANCLKGHGFSRAENVLGRIRATERMRRSATGREGLPAKFLIQLAGSFVLTLGGFLLAKELVGEAQVEVRFSQRVIDLDGLVVALSRLLQAAGLAITNAQRVED